MFDKFAIELTTFRKMYRLGDKLKVNLRFESFVNSIRCQTYSRRLYSSIPFESFVNSIRCQTKMLIILLIVLFESFVNSIRCQTLHAHISH